MQPSIIILTIVVAALTVLQIVPASLPVSVAQTVLIGALLVWFVGFTLKRTKAEHQRNSRRPGPQIYE